MKALVRSSVLAVVVSLVVLNIPAGATPIYSLTFQDVTFSVDLIDSNSFTLRIQNALNATGDWTDAVSLKSFQFKDIGDLGSGTETRPAWCEAVFKISSCGRGDNLSL
jgi:hypothetical protein